MADEGAKAEGASDLPPRRKERVDYKALHSGTVGDDMSKLPRHGHVSGAAEQGRLLSGEDGESGSGSDVALQYDADVIRRMREEFEALEKEEMVLKQQKEVAELRRKLEMKRKVVDTLKGEVNFSSRKKDSFVGANFNGAGQESSEEASIGIDNLTLKDLRRNKELKKKVRSNIKKMGVDILNASSDTESEGAVSFSRSKGMTSYSDLGSDRKKKLSKKKKSRTFVNEFSSSDSSESSDSDDLKKSKSKKSGILAKVSDRVKKAQRYPHSHLRFEFVNEAISFDKLNLNLFVAGELEIISNASVKDKEKMARIQLLKRLMYLSSCHDFSVIRSLYAAVLREIELGNLKWGDSFEYVESTLLQNQKFFRSDSNRSNKVKKEKIDSSDSEKVWFCSQYQRNKCLQKAPHTMVVKGVLRLAHHICATCWLKDKIKLEHPECSSSCPHSGD